MHSTATHNQFLRLRLQGLSLAKIGRRLGVSKPTLIAWSRKAKPNLEARFAAVQEKALSQVAASAAQQLADLTRRHNCLKQELLSRSFRDIPTPCLEQLAGEYNQKIQALQSNVGPLPVRLDTAGPQTDSAVGVGAPLSLVSLAPPPANPEPPNPSEPIRTPKILFPAQKIG